MSDLTKCEGTGCWVKDSCHRFLAESGYGQYYFIKPPFEILKEEFKCDLYWSDNTMEIWEQLKKIVDE
jgi:hypothetical protein